MSDQEYAEDMMGEADITGILEEYHRKQLLENLTGPAVSLLVHIIVLALMFIYVVSRPAVEPPTIEVSIIEEQIKEIEPEAIEEIDPEVETTTTDDAPSPTVSDAPTTDIGVDTSPVDVSDDAPQTDDNMDASDVLDVIATSSPLTLTGLYGGRTNAGRQKAVGKYGAGRPGQNAVRKALRWLASVQNEDGSWGTKYQSAHTGSALLVFLAHGETPLSETYGTTVQKAMRWLANKAQAGPMGREYEHGIAAYALAEAYAMTRIPFLRAAMEQSIDIIVYGQQNNGGFDYGYKKGARWDLSVSVWQYQALKAAYVAGASNDKLEEAMRKSINFLKTTCYSAPGFSYAAGRGGVRPNLTGAGAVALQLLGEGKAAQVRTAVNYVYEKRMPHYQTVISDPGKWDDIAGGSMYGWYYDTQAMFNAHVENADAKKRWEEWKKTFESALVKHQQPEGYWEMAKGHGLGKNLNGRILATCWSALQLTVYYRYLPTFDIEKMDKHQLTGGGANLEDAGAEGGILVIDIE